MSLGPSGATCYLYLLAYPSAEPIIPIPLWTFRSCIFKQHLPMEIGFTSISLFYGTKALHAFCLARETDIDCLLDLLAFLFIIHLALKSRSYRSKLPNLLKIMAEDATLYFLVIFTSHFLLVVTLVFGSVRTSPHRFVFSPADTFI